MVAPTSHDSSRADPTRRAVMRIPTLVQRVFGSVTVWRDHSFTSLVWAHAAQVRHGDLRSPCHKRSARHAEKQGELGLCQTSRRARARNPGVRTCKKGYASHQLVWMLCYGLTAFPTHHLPWKGFGLGQPPWLK